jgi:replicative DNA helicase
LTSLSRIVLSCLLAHRGWVADTRTQLGILVDQAFGADKFDAAVWTAINDLHSRDVDYTTLDVLSAIVAAGATDGLTQLHVLSTLAQSETRESFGRRLVALHEETYQQVARTTTARVLQKAEVDPAFNWDDALSQLGDGLRKRKRSDRRYVPLSFARIIESTTKEDVLIPTGFEGIDDAGGEFVVGKTQTVLARTNVGKSSFLAALALNQVASCAAYNIDRERERAPMIAHKIMEMRRRSGFAKAKDVPPVAPHVLLLSVEDTLDDYIGRMIVNLADIYAGEYRRNKQRAIEEHPCGDQSEAVREIAEVLSCGRLTIADYEAEDGHDEKTLQAIDETICGWVATTRSRCADEGEDDPPLLVLLDYFQKIKDPDAEKLLRDERRVLAKISDRLSTRARKKKFALVVAVMSLRGPDEVEPDENDARGGSDVIQDADAAWTLWPFGKRECKAIRKAEGTEMVASLDPDDEQGEALDLGETLTPIVARRAEAELLVIGNKSRHSDTGWKVPLQFDRGFKRITNAYDPKKIWRDDPTIAKIVAAARAHKSGKK